MVDGIVSRLAPWIGRSTSVPTDAAARCLMTVPACADAKVALPARLRSSCTASGKTIGTSTGATPRRRPHKHIRPTRGPTEFRPIRAGACPQPGRGPATSRPSLRRLRDDRVRDIGVPTSPMPCCGCTPIAERTMTWQDRCPQPDQAWHRARGHQGPVLAVLAMLAAKGRLRVAPRGCALPLTAAARGAL